MMNVQFLLSYMLYKIFSIPLLIEKNNIFTLGMLNDEKNLCGLTKVSMYIGLSRFKNSMSFFRQEYVVWNVEERVSRIENTRHNFLITVISYLLIIESNFCRPLKVMVVLTTVEEDGFIFSSNIRIKNETLTEVTQILKGFLLIV